MPIQCFAKRLTDLLCIVMAGEPLLHNNCLGEGFRKQSTNGVVKWEEPEVKKLICCIEKVFSIHASY